MEIILSFVEANIVWFMAGVLALADSFLHSIGDESCKIQKASETL